MLAVVMVSWHFETSDFNALLPLWAERGGKLLEMYNATDFQLLPLLQAWHWSLNLFICFESCTRCNLEFYFPYCNSTWRVSSLYLAGPLLCPVLNWPGCCCFFFVSSSPAIFRVGTSFCFKWTGSVWLKCFWTPEVFVSVSKLLFEGSLEFPEEPLETLGFTVSQQFCERG